MAGMQLSGLASGFDWKSIVDQLMTVEQAPITRLQKEQSTNTAKNSALSTLQTKMTALQDAVKALKADGLFTHRSATSSTANSSWSATAADNTTAGTYKVAVSQLATAAILTGGGNIAKALVSTADGETTSSKSLSDLSAGVAITAGTFTINGSQVSIELTDTLSSVFQKISDATSGEVTASYDSTNDTIKLESSNPSTIKVTLGAANDSSNFLRAMRLSNNNSGTVESSSALGSVSLTAALSSSNSRLSASSLSGSGSFAVNGVTINYNTATDSLNAIITRINQSTAGVSASYDSANDSMILVNKTTGDVGISVKDLTGPNLAAALKLTSSSNTTLTSGKNTLYTINGGGQLSSTSNVLDASSHGITGLSITANSESTETFTVAGDTSSAKSAIETFVTKYNDVQLYIDDQTKITTSNGKVISATLASDHEVTEWGRKMRSTAFSALSGLTGSLGRLSDLGIDFTSEENRLSIKDSSKLTSALSTKTSEVAEFFTKSSTGFVAKFGTFFDATLGTLGSKGSLGTQMQNLTNSNTSIDKQIADIQRRLDQQRSQLEASFLAMEQAQSKTNTMLSQLSKINSTTSS